jgi:NAD+ synthase (glutamine-hydrolysing)
VPASPQEICGLILHSCYMGTENSSGETQSRAKELAKHIGSYHLDIKIDTIVSSFLALFMAVTRTSPRFRSEGGSATENLALQNIQARTRMVVAYLFAQLLLWSRGMAGSLLVLGSSNVDETYAFVNIDCAGI